MTTREQVLIEARKWRGVPFLHQGRNAYGLDCIGLLLVICWKLKLTDYDVTGYGPTPDPVFLKNECDRLMTRVHAAMPGDVHLLCFRRAPQHLAIVTEAGAIHAYGGAGKVIEAPLPDAWRSRVVQSYRLPGVA